MKAGSIGEMPPSTRGRREFSAAIARAARIAMSEKVRHSGSRSTKSQCDLLFGSFQRITASIKRQSPAKGRAVARGCKRRSTEQRAANRVPSVEQLRDGGIALERARVPDEHGLAPIPELSRAFARC